MNQKMNKHHHGKRDCGCKSKPDCGDYKKIKCGCTEVIFKKNTAKVKCVEKLPCVAGYYLICREQTIENTSCEAPSLEPVERCLVVQIVQSEENPKFAYLQILNVTDSCPILLQLVEIHSKDPCKKWKMIGAGGNGARSYDFKLGDIRCWKVKDFKYTFVQGFSDNVVGSITTQLAATGCGCACRVDEEDVADLIDQFPEGQCEVV